MCCSARTSGRCRSCTRKSRKRWRPPISLPPGADMPDSADQPPNRAYLLPVEDTEFLLRDEMRGTRFMLEYEKAELSLRDWGVRSTVIVFGSARTPSPEQAEAELAA